MTTDSKSISASILLRSFLFWLMGLDWPVIIAVGLLLFIGLNTLAYQGNSFHAKQMDFFFAGLTACLFAWRIPPSIWTQKWVLALLYILNIVLLIAVMIAGHSALGAQRWLALGPITLQPSELAKLVVIFTLAFWLAKHPIKQFWDCFTAIGIILIPAFLVFKQPDLGTSLTFGAVYFGMLFWSGATLGDILILISPLISLVLNAINPAWWLYFVLILGSYLAFTWRRKNFHFLLRLVLISLILLGNLCAGEARPHLWGLLKEYQQKRLTSFVNPYSDPRGSGYHIIQSLIAIGSGGFTGTGLGKGNQSQGAFIPEKHTDFIFAVIGEEMGFKATALVIAAYCLICLRGILIAYHSREEPASSLIAIGITSMFLFHVFLNIGMTMGVMPVAGVPLPFLSYGGTALIIDLVAIGLLLAVETHTPAPRKDAWS